jgi:hypothetical protein
MVQRWPAVPSIKINFVGGQEIVGLLDRFMWSHRVRRHTVELQGLDRYEFAVTRCVSCGCHWTHHPPQVAPFGGRVVYRPPGTWPLD